MSKQNQAAFILANSSIFRDPEKDRRRMDEARTEAMELVRATLLKLEDPDTDTATEISRAYNLIGLLNKKLERIPR